VLVAGAAGALLGAAAVVEAGPVTILSQERRIAASADNGAGNTLADSETADDAGPFQAAVSRTSAATGAVYRSSASMNSTLGDDGLFFSGTLAYEVQRVAGGPVGLVRHELGIDVTFTLDRPYEFVFASDTTQVKTDPNVAGDAFLSLSRVDGGGSANLAELGSGVFEPGTYKLEYITGGQSIGLTGELTSRQLDYDISLALSAVDSGGGGGGNPGGNPIPLPPAVWSGAAVLGLGALNRMRKRRWL
jgi:hypothetical protein